MADLSPTGAWWCSLTFAPAGRHGTAGEHRVRIDAGATNRSWVAVSTMLRVSSTRGILVRRFSPMARLHPSDIPEEFARFAEAQVAAGRFASVAEVLLASKEALEQPEAYENGVKALRAAGEEGLESLRVHGLQLESDEDFDAFMAEAEAEALR